MYDPQVNAVLFAFGSLALLFLSAHADPAGLKPRLALLFGVFLSFALFRPLLPRGGYQRVAVAGGVLAGIFSFLTGARLAHSVALAGEGMLLGIFLAVTDSFTLRRGELRRLYNFSVVIPFVALVWHFGAIWSARVQIPRPPGGGSMAGEFLGIVSLCFLVQLAAPSLARGSRRKPNMKAPVPDELNMFSGAGKGITWGSAERDTMPASGPETTVSGAVNEEKNEEVG